MAKRSELAALFLALLIFPGDAAAQVTPPQGAAAPSATLRGQVTDPAGRPLVDAVVRVSPIREVSSRPRGQELTMRTGADGRFVLEGLAEGKPVWVGVCRKGYLTMEDEQVPSAQPLELKLQPGVRITGWVLAPEGRPIAGAAVRVHPPGGEPKNTFGDQVPPEAKATPHDSGGCSSEWVLTGADGSFTLDSLPRGWWSVEAVAKGYLSAVQSRLEVLRPPGLDRLEIVLSPGATLDGRVLAPDGSPVEGARVIAGSDGRPAVTDEDGAYHLIDIPPGETRLRAWHTGHLPGELKAAITPGENRLDLRLGAECNRISGHVLSPDGEPVEGAILYAERMEIPRVATLADGSFTVRCLPQGSTVQLAAQRDGYTFGRAKPLQIGEDPIEGLEIRLGPPPRRFVVTGRILGLRPEELARLRLGLRSSGPEPEPVQVDAAGRYRTTALQLSVYQLTADLGSRFIDCKLSLSGGPEVRAESWCAPQSQASEQAPPSRRVVLADGSDAVELDLMLPPGFEVSGRALAPDGKPLAGTRIELGAYATGHSSVAWSRADGSFAAGLESGAYCIRAYRQGYLQAEWQPLVVAGAAISGLEVRLRPRALLRGRIRGQEAWEQIGIRAGRLGEEWEIGGDVDPEGEYRIDVGPGEWEVVAEAFDPYRRGVGLVVVPPGATEARLDLELQPATMGPTEYAEARTDQACQLIPIGLD